MIYKTFIEGLSYWILFLSLFFLALLESIKQFSSARKIYAYISMVVIILFIGLRWETGTDWKSYKYLFDNFKFDSVYISLSSANFDPGYVFFNAIIKAFTDNYTLFLLINSFITIYVLYRIIKYLSPYPMLSLFYFYALFMASQFMGSNRRMMSMVFMLWAIYYLYHDSKKRYFFLLFLSFLFHRSSIIGLILLFLPKKRISIEISMVILICCLLLGMFKIPFKILENIGSLLSKATNSIIVQRIIIYSQDNDLHVATGAISDIFLRSIFGILKRCITLFLCIYIIKNNKIDKLTGFLFNIYILGFGMYTLFVGVFFQVVAAYFSLIEVLLIGRIYRYAQAWSKIFILFILLLYAALQLTNTLNTYPTAYLPYKNILSNIL